MMALLANTESALPKNVFLIKMFTHSKLHISHSPIHLSVYTKHNLIHHI